MAFQFSTLLLTTGDAATGSAIGMIGSFLAAAGLILAPVAFALIWVSQNDALSR